MIKIWNSVQFEVEYCSVGTDVTRACLNFYNRF